ncbi:MAG: class I SAM-dependent methyltransferase [Lachnospiraceae bacterium]|nr:class I SAM-dependent methyltransferase [Lachnospiraceae bacterium]
MGINDIIIYGAGKKGRAYLLFLQKHNMDSYVKGFCDRNAEMIGSIEKFPVISYQEACKMEVPFVVGVRKEMEDEVVKLLRGDRRKFYHSLDDWVVDEWHLMSRLDYEREICAISHIDSMNQYFEIAETDGALDFFWGKESICHKLFNRLDLENVVELACGRGRHVPHYLDRAGQVTLIDILEKNIDLCRQRFRGVDKISYVINNGYDFSELPDGSYTGLFTYDSMVHFELLDIASYLKETYRILKPGGRALFHHSNNDSDYKASYDTGVESRSFMNAKIFAYLAYRAGFEIEEQSIVDWIHPNLDCLTLVVKR